VAAVTTHKRPDIGHECGILFGKFHYFRFLHKRILLNVLGPTYHTHFQVPKITGAQLQQNITKPFAKDKSDKGNKKREMLFVSLKLSGFRRGYKSKL
jgi:hypothetical protein